MEDYYGRERGQRIDEPEWVPEIAALGWVIYSKDYAMRQDHLSVIVASNAKVFLLPDKKLNGALQTARFVDSRFRIALRARRDGPILCGVRPTYLEELPLGSP